MTELPRYDVELTGCTPEPLMAYLKALGILRLVSEQIDEEARGWWKNDVFHLCSTLDRVPLVNFFLQEYKPTPIVAPWAGGSGFFSRDNRDAVDALGMSTSPRIRTYAQVIGKVRAILKEEGISEKPRDEDKARLIRRYRCELPDEVINWIDAAMILQENGQGFAPLLGSGGNDGRLDFTLNFMQRIVALSLNEDAAPSARSRSWLEQALFGDPAKLTKASVGQFSPGRAGGPNATQGMEGEPTDNPWDFILMIEGTLLFAGAAARRLGANEASKAAFPFTVRTIAAGFTSPSPGDEPNSRGELWTPLWTRNTTLVELRQILTEGRAEVSGRRARDGLDFARAAVGLGVDHGLSAFNRYTFLKRSGKAFLAVPVGRLKIAQRANVNLLCEIDPWLTTFRSATEGKASSPRFRMALSRIDSAIFDFCTHGGMPLFQEILVALGQAERELSTGEQFRNEHNVHPVPGLSAQWLEAVDDGSVEFAIARALASIHDTEKKIGPLRANLEPVDWERRCRSWAERERRVVWSKASLATNLANILQRRIMDGQSEGTSHLPLGSSFTVSLDAVCAFIAGDVDDKRITELLWGLILIGEQNAVSCNYQGQTTSPLPRIYALLKLLFLPRPIALRRENISTSLAVTSPGVERSEITVRNEPSILPLLRSRRLGDACVIAARRLRGSGLDPAPRHVSGHHTRDTDWRESDYANPQLTDPERLAAALLIPIDEQAVDRLVTLVIRSNTETK